ncbi:MAG: hypothetical protein OHK93_001627 [Ramalina farinacea]|uniref:J domain-containing protein n=1 Tax=Ramalina farinacea TaxID=258253 RepID=A0AA43TWG4_9LECA|nr:hypothetical protein [Ramalina farinacea]
MAPAEVIEDYYAVLEVGPTATLDAITKSYRRLALLRHPDRNLLSVNATAAFQLVRSPLPLPSRRSHTDLPVQYTILTHPRRKTVEELQNAYQTLSSPTERQIYDRAHPSIKARHESNQRHAAAAQAEKQRATTRANSLRTLQAQLKRHEDELFESNRVLRKLEAFVRQSQELDAEDDQREKAKNSWWTYLATPIYGRVAEETEQEKSLRQMERLQRGASRRIKESEVVKQKKEVEGLQKKIGNLKSWIEAGEKRAADEDAAVERVRRARMQDEARERQERERRKREESLFRAEVMRKQREKEELERQQKAAQEYMERMERESREREDRWAEEARQRAREAAARAQRNQGRRNVQTNGTSVCRHQRFWNKIDDSRSGAQTARRWRVQAAGRNCEEKGRDHLNANANMMSMVGTPKTTVNGVSILDAMGQGG